MSCANVVNHRSSAEIYDELTQRGFSVTPQVNAGQYRIDMVVEGGNDARLAVECDGDRYHGADKWAARHAAPERVLERAGWVFWRVLRLSVSSAGGRKCWTNCWRLSPSAALKQSELRARRGACTSSTG